MSFIGFLNEEEPLVVRVESGGITRPWPLELAMLSSTPNNQRRINFIEDYIHFNILALTSILHVRTLLTKYCKHCGSWLLSFYVR